MENGLRIWDQGENKYFKDIKLIFKDERIKKKKKEEEEKQSGREEYEVLS